ncbi:MAG: c-type cytochrome biogenesis protein CcsB [Nitriliruptorales bacterium]
MSNLAELSRTLFFPWTFLLYIAATVAYLFHTAYASVDGEEADRSRVGALAGRVGAALALAGIGLHLASVVLRGVSAGARIPWANMYEYSSVMGLGIVALAVGLVHWRLRRSELVGFVLLAALLTMGGAQVLYTPAGGVMPALQTHWLKIHTFSVMVSATIFTVAFVFTGLYLIRDLAERRVAAAQESRRAGSTVGAAYAGPSVADETADTDAERPEGYEDDGALPEPSLDLDRGEYGRALRAAVNPIPMAISAAAMTTAYALLFRNPVAAFVAPTVVALGAVAAWWFLPALPSAATLDSIAYRTTAFAFPIWTFGVIAGAVWAEQSWGRYWGWDPKETGAFLTWVAYAGYLHARATRGLRGRGAAGIGVVAFLLLLFTYYAVNLWVVGLHSYAGTGVDASNPPYWGIAGALGVYGAVKLFERYGSRTSPGISRT